MNYDFSALFYSLVLLGAAIVLSIWGGWEVIDWLCIDDVIKVSKPLVPTLELVIKNNQVDTLYVYRLP